MSHVRCGVLFLATLWRSRPAPAGGCRTVREQRDPTMSCASDRRDVASDNRGRHGRGAWRVGRTRRPRPPPPRAHVTPAGPQTGPR
ncbi:hypothetical protein EVAR_62974_1 [Eumeta japonica]|uniref:Secreted protein n=1 Tax=Eumeta variegata TaxID=151549 RepID=A0A4C1ZE66_EUMVA|nr:hypothetical protein EVAR_62974_1 [Eumeta japonica]